MLIALIITTRPVFTQSVGEREFVGTIGKTLRVRIKLSRANDALTGSYSYEKIGKSLRLDGKIDGEEFTLNEFDERGNQTGKFTGKFVTEDWIDGTWSSTDDKKQMAFSAWVLDGKHIPATDPNDKISGEYRRIYNGKFDRNTATLDIWLLKDGRVRVNGDAVWVGVVKDNVHIGEADGVFTIRGKEILYKDGDSADNCSFTITFGAGSLTVKDDNGQCGGMNVTFDGSYKRVGAPRP